MIQRVALLITFAGLWLPVPIWAHHWAEAQYDSHKVVTMTGTVTRMDWFNPHTHFYIDVKARTGKLTHWEFEMGSPNGMHHLGWNRTTLKPGDVITVTGYLARDGTPTANARSVILSDGRKLLAAASEDGSR
jgi:hypothetical protein